MIIDKINLTKREQERLKELSSQIEQALFAIPTHEGGDTSIKSDPNFIEYCAILNGAEDRYIASISPDYAAIIGNAKEVIAAYTAQDFLAQVEPVQATIKKEIPFRKAQLAAAEGDPAKQAGIMAIIAEQKDRLLNFFSVSYISILNNLKQLTGPEIRALKNGGHTDNEYISILESRAREIEAELSDRVAEETQLSIFDELPEEFVTGTDAISAGLDLSLLPSISLERLNRLDFPLDKINRSIWYLLEADTGGQIGLKAEQMGSKKQVTILYSIDFENLPPNISITKKLEPFDKRIYVAVAALFNSGKTVITYTEIYCNMGYKGRPGASDLDKIDRAISKMSGAHIYVNNRSEIKAKYNYPEFFYDGSLLPLERVRAVVNGQITDGAINVFREPPLISFARGRKQITTIQRKLLESPLSKTNQNLRLEDYLIEEITGVKRQRRRNKFLYDTVYREAGISTVKQKQRAPDKIKKLLEHYVACQFIERYEMRKDGFTVYYAQNGQNSDT